MSWIKTSERLPEELVTVILKLDDEYDFGWIEKGDCGLYWEGHCDPYDINDVDHWMYIPPLPEEQGE